MLRPALRAAALLAAAALCGCTAPPPQPSGPELLLERDLDSVRGVLEQTLRQLDLFVVSTGTRPGGIEVRAATASGAALLVRLDQVTEQATQVEVLAPGSGHFASWLAGKLTDRLAAGVKALPPTASAR